VVLALVSHADDATVQAEACRALAYLALNADTRKQIVEAGGIEKIIAALAAHLQNAVVQFEGCRALANFGMETSNETRIAGADGVEAVVAALRAHEENCSVQSEGCRAIANLSLCAGIKARILDAGGADVVLGALRNHRQNSQVQVQACRAFAILGNETAYGAEISESDNISARKMDETKRLQEIIREKQRVKKELETTEMEKKRVEEELATKKAEMQHVDEELRFKRREVERVELALASRTCQVHDEEAVPRRTPSAQGFCKRLKRRVSTKQDDVTRELNAKVGEDQTDTEYLKPSRILDVILGPAPRSGARGMARPVLPGVPVPVPRPSVSPPGSTTSTHGRGGRSATGAARAPPLEHQVATRAARQIPNPPCRPPQLDVLTGSASPDEDLAVKAREKLRVEEELGLKIQEKQRVEEELMMQVNAKAALDAEVAARMFEKLQIEENLVVSLRHEDDAFWRVRKEMESLEGEVKAGYSFVIADVQPDSESDEEKEKEPDNNDDDGLTAESDTLKKMRATKFFKTMFKSQKEFDPDMQNLEYSSESCPPEFRRDHGWSTDMQWGITDESTDATMDSD
jgi:hypothetical protein